MPEKNAVHQYSKSTTKASDDKIKLKEKVNNKIEIPGSSSKIRSESFERHEKSVSERKRERSQNFKDEIEDIVKRFEPYKNKPQIKIDKSADNPISSIEKAPQENKSRLQVKQMETFIPAIEITKKETGYGEKSGTKAGSSQDVEIAKTKKPVVKETPKDKSKSSKDEMEEIVKRFEPYRTKPHTTPIRKSEENVEPVITQDMPTKVSPVKEEQVEHAKQIIAEEYIPNSKPNNRTSDENIRLTDDPNIDIKSIQNSICPRKESKIDITEEKTENTNPLKKSTSTTSIKDTLIEFFRNPTKVVSNYSLLNTDNIKKSEMASTSQKPPRKILYV